MLLRNIIKPLPKSLPSCREVTGMTVEECVVCARTTATLLRAGWLRAIGAPDYRAYLAHHAARHPGIPPTSERDYVKLFIERRYNRRGVGGCC